MSQSRSATPAFLLFGFALLIAIATGADWIGRPFRPVHLVTILGLGMTAGVTWMQAILRWRETRPRKDEPST